MNSSGLIKFQELSLLFLSATFLLSCSKEIKEDSRNEARLLFNQTIDILNEYSDSISKVTDIFQIWVLNDNLNDKLTKINYEHSPNLDLKLSQQENDSIVLLIQKFINEKNNSLNRLKHTINNIENQDTLLLES